jgi:thiol-disulfide isomerase/thioredoxin
MWRRNDMKWILLVLGMIIMLGCTQQAENPPPIDESMDWRDVELTDSTTGETFRISDFEGKPVLLESFAVWCSTCLLQQKEIRKLQDDENDTTIHVSLDTDPNEDDSAVRAHQERNGFDWYFAVSPSNLTQKLIDEFGLSFVNAPTAPVVLICEDQSTRFLENGVKSAEELKQEIEVGC